MRLEEVSRINAETNWVQLPNFKWEIQGRDGIVLGQANANICRVTGRTTFSFKVNRSTFINVEDVENVDVDAPNLTDATERQKLMDFDHAIASAFDLTDD